VKIHVYWNITPCSLVDCHRCFGSTSSLHILLCLVTISPVETDSRSFQQNASPPYSVIARVVCTNPPAGRYMVLVNAERSLFVLCWLVHGKLCRCHERRRAKNSQNKTLTDIRFVYAFCNGNKWAVTEEKGIGFSPVAIQA
jgi:hypothetical protein